MVKSRKRRKRKQRFEAASALVLGRRLIRRRPAAFHRRYVWLRDVLLVVLGVVAVGALWLAFDNRFYVYKADIVGTVRLSPDEVFQTSGLSGLHILWARPAQIEEQILNTLPTLESAQVKCDLPATCAIVVVERQPKVLWDEDGAMWWIDAEGVVFGAEGTLVEGWTVRGPLPRDEEGHLDKNMCVALNELWATGDDVASVFDYVPGRGLSFVDERGWRVVLGRRPGMVKRLEVLERLTTNLEARGLTPRFVDVRFADAPYYSLTDEW